MPETPVPLSPVLRVENLAISFTQARPAVEDISISLQAGEILALVGESGSGKSMTARAVLGLLPPGAQPSGEIWYDDQDLLSLDDAGLNRIRGSRIAMVFQEPQTALNPVRTIGWQLREALRAHGVEARSRSVVRERSLELLRQVEIPEPERRLGSYPHQLSGGQKQRVVLALALANEPEVLLADEPTTALDVTVQAEILRLLQRIRNDTGTAVVLITHNMGVVAEIADRVVVLQAGNVVESGETRELVARPQEPYTKTLLASVLRLPARSDAPGADAPDLARGQHASRATTTRTSHDQSTHFVPATVEFRNVHVHYGSRRRGRAFPAVTDVSLSVAPGEVVGLVGESGSGKTTLGRVAAGLVPLADGSKLTSGVLIASAYLAGCGDALLRPPAVSGHPGDLGGGPLRVPVQPGVHVQRPLGGHRRVPALQEVLGARRRQPGYAPCPTLRTPRHAGIVRPGRCAGPLPTRD